MGVQIQILEKSFQIEQERKLVLDDIDLHLNKGDFLTIIGPSGCGKSISKKPFMRGKKQQLEIILIYIWLHEIWGDEDNYWEEYCKKTVSN